MNAIIGTPTGTKGTVTFDGDQPDAPAYMVDGKVYVQSVNPNLWLGSTARPDQFTETVTPTTLVCVECGNGNYFHTGNGVYACTKGCGHEITWADILPEVDEEVVLVNGRIAIATI